MDDLLTGRPLVAILRGVAPADAVRLAHAVWDTGLGVVEVPIQTPSALRALRAVAEAAADRGEVAGAGTVTSTTLVAQAAGAGARFTVAPGLDLDVMAASLAAGMPHLPGVGSATDIQRALAAGAHWLKVFPAGALGSAWIQQMCGPFPQARFVATGGIDAANAAGFLRAGARALGVGGSITRPGGLASLIAAIGGATDAG
jgi:2-dehydro-3-deoxyphosphogluconate aldolase/(4S)-4-hydroxy-2-oxoglutarate aldolase